MLLLYWTYTNTISHNFKFHFFYCSMTRLLHLYFQPSTIRKPVLACILGIVFINPCMLFAQSPILLKDENTYLAAHINQYDTANFNKLTNHYKLLLNSEVTKAEVNTSSWTVHKRVTAVSGVKECYNVQIVFHCMQGNLAAASVSLDINFTEWSIKNYVLMPGAVYNGNRVKSIKQPYLTFWADARDIGINKPQLVSDIPRLNINDGPSRIQQRSGDMTTPAIGFFDSLQKKGFWLLTNQASGKIDNGIDIEESATRNNATISITAPVVREQFSYFIADNTAPSKDKPANFTKGDSVVIAATIYFFDCDNVQGLYNYFASVKNDVLPEQEAPATVPFSAAFDMLEEKFNRQNFEPTFGYYSVGMRESCYQDWQIGWTGGMISTYPLLLSGSDSTRNNVIKNFDWLFNGGVSPSGYFWDTGEKGNKWFGIFPSSSVAKDLHLVRKSGDGLLYILKQFAAFKKLGIQVKPVWENGTKTVADAFVNTWKRYGQLGQYVNNTSGELIIGGSTSGGIVPGALVLAAAYFNEPQYALIAKEIAADYFQKYISRGLIYGAAGDAMQNFDSESSYALIESYMLLYEYTNDKHWLSIAEDVAMQFATWVSSYEYIFPANSTLGKLNKKTTGVVWANTQNKHGAPGICTHSGLALLRLYRSTGKEYYLHLLQLIAKAIPQYISTKESPIPGLQESWISERVSTTDWLEGIGEIFPGSTWAETAMMLTATELPGIYVDTKRTIIACFDQLSVRIIKQTKNNIQIEISNPTIYNCITNMFVDREKGRGVSLFQEGAIKIALKPGEVKLITIKR